MSTNIPTAQQNFSRCQCGNQPLEEVTELVIRISAKPEHLLNLKTNRNLCVGVHSTNHQNDGVEENQSIEKGSQRVSPVCGKQKWDDDNDGRHLHQPGDAIAREQAGIKQDHQQEQ
ncbi:Uncharacterised protein [Enterobacter cloacae]|nr:Uncharacterised protein [Enterobacter cloacae]